MSELPFLLSASALDELESILLSKKIPEGYGVRLGIKGSGCAGVSYVIGFDTASEGDKIYPNGKLHFLVAKKHLLYISGLSIDFVDTNEERGFVFEHQSF
ncbi:MAG: Iron-sulfur cluster assembly accessory protein [Chitinophagaceae bacterium]|nr:Iron-sulfur cluster assembly accessory protein [Chitinophagaceae bacterium]